MNRLIIAGSPRTDGRSAALANQLFEACIEDCPQDEVALAPVATLAIEGCQGCGGCSGDGDDDDGFRCCLEDDMQDLYPLIEAADELVVVSPVYFAGPPAQLKALLDRLQPYYWIRQRGKRGGTKRPATLHVIGEGGDPHGFEPLVGTVRSALACAGFALESVHDWVGKINEDGEITAEAAEHPLASLPRTGLTEEDSSVKSERPLLCLAEEKPASPSQGKAKQQARKSNPQSKHSNSGQNHSQGGGRQAAKHMQGKRSGDKQTAKRVQGKQPNGNRSNDKLSKGKQSSGKQPTGKQAKGKRRG